MRRIFAIASISMRTAFRSRVVLTLMMLLGVVIIGIPLTIKGDGTLPGYIHILIDYTLNFVRVILAIATIWAGCASISQEVDTKQVQMTMTKPVHPLQMWLGKWLGLLAPVFLLILFSGVIVYGMLMWNVRSSQLTSEEQFILRKDLLVGRIETTPEDPLNLGATIDDMIESARENDSLPNDYTESQLREAARQTIIRSRQTISPGEACEWLFHLPDRPDDSVLTIEYRASSSQIGGLALPGLWRITDEESTVLYEKNTVISTKQDNHIDIPGHLLAGNSAVQIEYSNLDEEETLIFFPDDSITVLSYASSFEMTYLKTLLIIFFQIAFLAAIAVSMGAFFSTPVAVFTSIFALLLVFMNNYIHEMSQETQYVESSPNAAPGTASFNNFVNDAVHYVFIALDTIIEPLSSANALELCSRGRHVSWRLLGTVFLYRIVIYCGIISVLSAWIFKRRELALPQR